jgi:hypothetical protein
MHLFYSLSTAIGAGILSYNLFDGDIKTTVAISLLVFGYIGSLLFVSQTKNNKGTPKKDATKEDAPKED